jgi:lipooligosaccharide transport system permease protein
VLGAAEPWAVLVALPILFLTGLCFAGLALIMTAISPGYDFFSYYTTLVITPMWVLSGVFYPVSNLPEALHYVSLVLPLTHSVELIRDLVGGGLSHDSLVHFGVLGVVTVVGGSAAVMMVKRRLIV